MSKQIAEPISARSEMDWASPAHVQALVLMVTKAIGIILCYQLIAPFIPAIVWATTLAVLFSPIQKWLERVLRNSSFAAGVAVFSIGLILVIPLTFALQNLVMQAAQGSELIDAKVESGEWRRSLESQPLIAPWAERFERQFDLPGAVKIASSWMSTTAVSIVRGSVLQVIAFCITFYLLFFLLRDRMSALELIRKLSPFSNGEMDDLFCRVNDTIHATIYGTLFVATVQGTLGGLMFWWLGLPAPLLWGMVMTLLSMIPMVGSLVVWLPTSLFLALEGSPGKAILLGLWGMLVVGTVDNLIRPVLVGNRLKQHTALSFLSIVGGLLLFGPSGLVLGPVILTVTTWLLVVGSRVRVPIPLGDFDDGAISRFDNEGGIHFSKEVGIL